MTDVALASAATMDDPDTPLLVAALGALGLEARAVAWTDAAVDWHAFAATVIRSTWDYPMAHGDFVAWARGVPNLHNPADVVVWNSDKRYLDDLAAAGVPTIPTTYASRGTDAVLPDDAVVVKPTVAGGSRGAARFGRDEHDGARAHVDAIAALGLEAIIQPLVASVDASGETDVVVLDGEVTHALVKRAPIGLAATAQPSGPVAVTLVDPSDDELAVVDAALHALPFDVPLCYARIDLVALDAGPAVIEVELIEPFLFLAEKPGVAGTLAAAIARRIAGA